MTASDAFGAGIAEILTVIRNTSTEVAAYQRSVVRSIFDRGQKRDRHDVVTEHDRRAERIAVAGLREAFPGCRIVGEEYGEMPGSGAEAALAFYVDPIDGTSNFVAGMPLFAVSIGAAVNGDLVAGVVNAPLLGHEFYAGAGIGAWVDSFDAEEPVRLGQRIERSTEDCLLLTGFPSPRDLDTWGGPTASVASSLARKVMSVRNLGTTAIELALVAAGWVDATYGTGAGSWDLAAGMMIAREAGCSTWHRQFLGPNRALEWEQPGYAAAAPGRRIPELVKTFDRLQQIADEIRRH